MMWSFGDIVVMKRGARTHTLLVSIPLMMISSGLVIGSVVVTVPSGATKSMVGLIMRVEAFKEASSPRTDMTQSRMWVVDIERMEAPDSNLRSARLNPYEDWRIDQLRIKRNPSPSPWARTKAR